MRALLLMMVLAPAAARAQSVEARLADLRLATAVRLALVQDAATRALDVNVTAESGAVRLAGDGLSAASRVARGVAGVRSVNGQGDAATALAPSTGPARAETRPEAEARTAPASDVPTAAPRGASPWGAAPRPEAPSGAEAETHVVGRGETLFSLARRYDTTVEALRRINGLSATAAIEAGQRLRVR